jgi:hypothetical protein
VDALVTVSLAERLKRIADTFRLIVIYFENYLRNALFFSVNV